MRFVVLCDLLSCVRWLGFGRLGLTLFLVSGYCNGMRLLGLPLLFALVFFGMVLSASFSFAAKAKSSLGVVCTVAKPTELRKGPGAEYDVTLRVNPYTPLTVSEKQKKWLKVTDLEKESFWVEAKAVSEKEDCVVVKSETAYLRKGPGKEFLSADDIRVDRLTPFRKVGREKGWLQVETMFKERLWIYSVNVWDPKSDSK